MIPRIEEWIRTFIKDRNLVVLRHAKSRKALGVSYSVDGLKWTTDPLGRSLYFNRAILKHNKIGNHYIPYFTGDLSKRKDVIVETFVPEDHRSAVNQKAELLWCDKALRMLYTAK